MRKDKFWIDEKLEPGKFLLRDDGDMVRGYIIAKFVDEKDAFEALERIKSFYRNRS